MSGLWYDQETRIDQSPALYEVGDVVRLSNGARDEIVAVSRSKGHSGYGIQYKTRYLGYVWQNKQDATTEYNHNRMPERSYRHPLCESYYVWIVNKVNK